MFSPLPLLFCRLLLGWLWLVAVAGGRRWWSWWVVVSGGWGWWLWLLLGRSLVVGDWVWLLVAWVVGTVSPSSPDGFS
ncbi:unnamed protein product [Prunus armeniaca]